MWLLASCHGRPFGLSGTALLLVPATLQILAGSGQPLPVTAVLPHDPLGVACFDPVSLQLRKNQSHPAPRSGLSISPTIPLFPEEQSVGSRQLSESCGREFHKLHFGNDLFCHLARGVLKILGRPLASTRGPSFHKVQQKGCFCSRV